MLFSCEKPFTVLLEIVLKLNHKVSFLFAFLFVFFLRSTIGECSHKLGVPVVTWGSCGQQSRDFAGLKNRDFLGERTMCKICAILNFE